MGDSAICKKIDTKNVIKATDVKFLCLNIRNKQALKLKLKKLNPNNPNIETLCIRDGKFISA